MLKRINLREKKRLPFLCYSLPLHIYIDLYKYIQVTLGLPLWGFKIPSSSSKSGDLRDINDHRRTPSTPPSYFSARSFPYLPAVTLNVPIKKRTFFYFFLPSCALFFQAKSLRLRFPACIIMLGIFFSFFKVFP